MTNAKFLALADRCEQEEPSWALSVAIEVAITPGAIERTWDYWVRVGLGDKAWNPPDYAHSTDAAAKLEPKDAQEVCIRKYPNGGMYVRITTAAGKPVYCEVLDRPITEAMARCAAGLRAMAAK